jgi:CDP-4-dehydro-6-deoxyglucose reductase, E1
MSIDWPLATSSWDKDEIAAIEQVVSSGNFTMGPKVLEFEQNFANFTGTKFALMCNSGSSANLLMVAALRYRNNLSINAGDEIIVPAVSWSTSYFPLVQYGLRLKFVDIDIHTLNYDLEKLESAISHNTKAILAVNLLGNLNDFTEINKMIEGKKIIVIEDNCESMGASLNGKKSGAFGLMASHSCFFSHHISTMEGGLVSTNDEELYQIMISLRAHGWTRNLPENNFVSGKKNADAFDESFNFVLPGYNLRPLEMSGAIGVEQLKKLPNLISARRKNAEYFMKVAENIPWLLTQKEIGKSSWFGFSLILDECAPKSRQELLKTMQGLNVDVRPIVAGNFMNNPALKYFDYTVHSNLINAEYLDKNGFFVGNHHYCIKDKIDQFFNWLSGY